MSRYTIVVESKGRSANSLEEALTTFGGMMCINKEQVRHDLQEKGEAMQVYGFCSGSVIDNDFDTSGVTK